MRLLQGLMQLLLSSLGSSGLLFFQMNLLIKATGGRLWMLWCPQLSPVSSTFFGKRRWGVQACCIGHLQLFILTRPDLVADKKARERGLLGLFTPTSLFALPCSTGLLERDAVQHGCLSVFLCADIAHCLLGVLEVSPAFVIGSRMGFPTHPSSSSVCFALRTGIRFQPLRKGGTSRWPRSQILGARNLFFLQSPTQAMCLETHCVAWLACKSPLKPFARPSPRGMLQQQWERAVANGWRAQSCMCKRSQVSTMASPFSKDL